MGHGKHHSPEQIITKLREADAMLADMAMHQLSLPSPSENETDGANEHGS